MKTSQAVEIVREGRYVGEVDVTVIETESDWSPYLSIDDAEKLDGIRLALRHGDLKAAAKVGRVFEMLPVAAE